MKWSVDKKSVYSAYSAAFSSNTGMNALRYNQLKMFFSEFGMLLLLLVLLTFSLYFASLVFANPSPVEYLCGGLGILFFAASFVFHFKKAIGRNVSYEFGSDGFVINGDRVPAKDVLFIALGKKWAEETVKAKSAKELIMKITSREIARGRRGKVVDFHYLPFNLTPPQIRGIAENGEPEFSGVIRQFFERFSGYSVVLLVSKSSLDAMILPENQVADFERKAIAQFSGKVVQLGLPG